MQHVSSIIDRKAVAVSDEITIDSYLELLAGFPLFQGLSLEEIEQLLICTDAHLHNATRGEMLVERGHLGNTVVLMLDGMMKSVFGNVENSRNIAEQFGPGGCFGIAYCILDIPVHVQLLASRNSSVMYLRADRLFGCCEKNCDFHCLFIKNTLTILAKKLMILAEKIEYMHMHTLRSALAAFLTTKSREFDAKTFAIGMNRTELSEYFNVSRFSLIRELNYLRDSGLIEFENKTFRILNQEGLTRIIQADYRF